MSCSAILTMPRSSPAFRAKPWCCIPDMMSWSMCARRRCRIQHLRLAHIDQLIMSGMQHQGLALKAGELRGIVKMALQLIDKRRFGYAKFCGLEPQKKPLGDIGDTAFENQAGDLGMFGHAMHGIQ